MRTQLESIRTYTRGLTSSATANDRRGLSKPSSLKSLKLVNYKGFENHTISLRQTNVLVSRQLLSTTGLRSPASVVLRLS